MHSAEKGRIKQCSIDIKSTTHELSGLCASLYITDELLLLLLQFRSLSIELALSLREGTLVLPQSLSRCHRASEECFLDIMMI